MIEQSHVLDLMLAVAYPQIAYLELQLKRVIFIAPPLKHGAVEILATF